MSRWHYRLQLDSGLALLSGFSMDLAWNADGPRLQIDVSRSACANQSGEGIFLTLVEAARAQGFVVSGVGGSVASLPPPWNVWSRPAAMLSPGDMLGAELAVELWLLQSRDINDLDSAKKTLEERSLTLQDDVREALAYWLLSSTHELGGRQDLKKSWRSDVDEVLVMRSPNWTSRRRPGGVPSAVESWDGGRITI